MAKKRVTEALWKAIAPLLPEHKPSPKGRTAAGPRPRLPGGDHLRAQDRHALADAADPTGIRQRQHLLAAVPRLDATGGLARTAPAAVARPRPARPAQPRTRGDRQRLGEGAERGAHTGPNPTDRGKNGCKRHIVTDADGIPLVVRTGPANQPDAEMALEMLDAIPPCGGRERPAATTAQGVPGRRGVRDQGDHRGGRAAAGSLAAGALRQGADGARQRAWARPATSSSGRSAG